MIFRDGWSEDRSSVAQGDVGTDITWVEIGRVSLTDFEEMPDRIDDLGQGNGITIPIVFDRQWCEWFLKVSRDRNKKLHSGPNGIVQGAAFPLLVGAVTSWLLPNYQTRDLPLSVKKEVPIGTTVHVGVACLKYRKANSALESVRMKISITLDDGSIVIAPIELMLFRRLPKVG